MKILVKDCTGSMLPLLLVIIFFLFSLAGIVGEVYRAHGLQESVEYNLQRGINVATEEAMLDSWRQDKQNKVDGQRIKDDFQEYLQKEMGLTATNEKIVDGKIVYKLEFSSIEVTESLPPRLSVKGKLVADSAYSFLGAGKIVIPFSLASVNRRTD